MLSKVIEPLPKISCRFKFRATEDEKVDNSEEQKHIQENNGFARIEPYTHPAGGWGALLSHPLISS
jgi:hypothetical protein